VRRCEAERCHHFFIDDKIVWSDGTLQKFPIDEAMQDIYMTD
jgi:hypothetical protein